MQTVDAGEAHREVHGVRAHELPVCVQRARREAAVGETHALRVAAQLVLEGLLQHPCELLARMLAVSCMGVALGRSRHAPA